MKDIPENAGGIEAISDLAHAAAAPKVSQVGFEHGKPFVVVPATHKVHHLPYLPEKPSRIRAALTFGSIVSFARYVNEHKDSTTRVFGKITDGTCRFVAVLDYHKIDGTASHCTHTADFVPAVSLEWKRWKEASGKPMGQEEFARFIEDNTRDILKPSGAEVLQIATTLEIDGQVTFRRGVRLANGTVSLTYKEEQTARSGELHIPEEFILGIPVFDGETPVQIKARFRHKLETGGEIKLWFELVDPVRELNEAARRAAAQFQALTEIEPYDGQFVNKDSY